MPSNKTRNTLARQWELLKMLPTRGAGKTAKEIADALAEAGFAVSKRQVERDLLDLQEVFGLECNDASIPYGWRWGAAPLELPGVTLAEALSLKLVEDTLKPLLPASVLRTIQPRLTQAKAKLAALSEQNPSARWAEKVASVSPSLPMMPPIVDEEILDTVQNALLSGEQICAVYKRISSDAKELTLHPLGLVIRGGVTYLVATAYDYADVRLFALHRFESAKRNYELVKTPKGRKLSSYLDDGALQFGSGVVVRLVARISDGLARHLEETPLAANQKLKSIEEGVQLTVSVPDTWQLHWWILSQGPSIVIVAPESLRERVAKALLEASGNYQSVNLE